MKEFYKLDEASKYLSRKLEEDFNLFDLILTTAKNKINLSMYHSGFVGVSSFSIGISSNEKVAKRIPFDGVVEITSLGYIEEVYENSEFLISEIVPKHWIRHDIKKMRIIEELSKIEDPRIYMVDHTNLILFKTISIDKFLISQESLVKLMFYLKDLTDEPIKTNEQKKDLLGNKERETLLVIIAALAKEAKIDITKTSKTGELIASMTQQLGANVGATTIETHLKKIPQALQSRAK